jgi:hypothetical protein
MESKDYERHSETITIPPAHVGLRGGGRWSSGKYVGTTCLRAAGSSPAPPAVWVLWRLIWRTESLDRGLILVCRFSFDSSRSAPITRGEGSR